MKNNCLNIMIKKCFLLFFFVLTGCTDNGVLIRSNGNYETDANQSIIYKIGDPYQIQDEVYTPKEDYTYSETGQAGWFTNDGDHFVTANGEKYRPYRLTAMHKTLPLPSIVKITNLDNSRSLLVRVNDRGPYVNNRIIDVSELTAKTLGFNMTGTTPVRVEIMPKESLALKEELTGIISEENYPISFQKNQLVYDGMTDRLNEGEYQIQVGAFSQYQTAQKIKNDLSNYPVFIQDLTQQNQTLYRVRVGPFKTYQQALNVLDNVRQSGYSEAKLVDQNN